MKNVVILVKDKKLFDFVKQQTKEATEIVRAYEAAPLKSVCEGCNKPHEKPIAIFN